MSHQSDTPTYTLSPRQLAARLGISEKKLAHDRLRGEGIPYLKIGRLVRYRMVDVLAYEGKRLRISTADVGDRYE